MLRTFTFLVGFLLTASAFADGTCYNVSGDYALSESSIIRYTQSGCDTLHRYYGHRTSEGTHFFDTGAYRLDGTPTCHGANCESATLQPAGVAIQLNFNGGVNSPEHGACLQRAYVLSKDAEGNLNIDFAAFQCRDGYQGNVRLMFHKAQAL